MAVAATQVSPEKQMSSPPRKPSFCNSATLIARGKRSHITTSPEAVAVAPEVFLDFLVDFFLLLFVVGILRQTPFDRCELETNLFASMPLNLNLSHAAVNLFFSALSWAFLCAGARR